MGRLLLHVALSIPVRMIVGSIILTLMHHRSQDHPLELARCKALAALRIRRTPN